MTIYAELNASTVNILKVRKSKARKLAAILPRHALNIRLEFIGRLKFGRTSNFCKGGTPGYCLMAIYTSGAVLDNGTCT